MLTKDNLAKRNWPGNLSCVFCDHEETINHLFCECIFAKTLWHIITPALGVKKPSNMQNGMGRWMRSCPNNLKSQFIVGVAAVFWSIYMVVKK
jgi:hypothetical protein